MSVEIENAVLFRHGAQARVEVVRVMQLDMDANRAMPWYWLALKLPGEPQKLLGRRKTQGELLALVEKIESR